MKTTAHERLLDLPPFHEWLPEIAHEIEDTQKMLDSALEDSPTRLMEQLSATEAQHSRMTKLLVDAGGQLTRAKHHALVWGKKDNPDLNSNELRIVVAFTVQSEQMVYDRLDGLCVVIRNRCMVAMNMRKQNAGERSNW